MRFGKCFAVKGTQITELNTAITDIPEINGQVNVDCHGGLVYQCPDTGTVIRSGHIGPEGYLAPHRVDNSAYVRIIGGSGTIGLADTDGKSICEINVQEGDEVIFEKPMELHYYIAGHQGLDYRVFSF